MTGTQGRHSGAILIKEAADAANRVEPRVNSRPYASGIWTGVFYFCKSYIKTKHKRSNSHEYNDGSNCLPRKT